MKTSLRSILATAFLFGCIIWLACGKTNAGQHTYTFVWEYDDPQGQGVHHYELFLWTGIDTTQSPFIENTAAELYDSYLILSPSVGNLSAEYGIESDGKIWIDAAICAVDSAGNKSRINTLPNPILTPDETDPSPPTALNIAGS